MPIIRWILTAFFLAVVSFSWAKEIVVVSYNLENYLGESSATTPPSKTEKPKPEAQIQALLSMIQDLKPDILGVMEMGGKDVFLDFQNRLLGCGLNFKFTEWIEGDDHIRHIALLSRFPISKRDSQANMPFDLEGRRFHMVRGILDVTIEASPAYSLRLVGLHLKSRRPVPEYDEKKFRAREALVVRRYLDDILEKNPEEKLLVFGDLNDTKNEFPITHILGVRGTPSALREIPLKDDAGLTWTHFWGAADVYSRIDYFLAGRGLWPEVILEKCGIFSSPLWREASDHRPVFLTLSVPE